MVYNVPVTATEDSQRLDALEHSKLNLTLQFGLTHIGAYRDDIFQLFDQEKLPFRPVIEPGGPVPEDPWDTPPSKLPLMAGHTSTEGAFYTGFREYDSVGNTVEDPSKRLLA